MTGLLPPAPAAREPILRRLARWLGWTWGGRLFLGALVLRILDAAGAPLPCGVDVLASIALFVFAALFLYRLARYVLFRLLWRIRTKLLVSYLFIAVVPLVLLALLFAIAGVLFSGLVASHIVTSEVERLALELRGIAQTALSGLPAGTPATQAAVEKALADARRVHPEIAWTLVRGGKVVASSGTTAHELPAWIQPPGFAGLVLEGDDGDDTLRAVVLQPDQFLVVDAPLDARLFQPLDERMGIRFLTAGGTLRRSGDGMNIHVNGRKDPPHPAARKVKPPIGTVSGFVFLATPERRKWATGEVELDPLSFQFAPRLMLQRLSPRTFNMAQFLVVALAAVGGVFLVVYAVALLLGFLLARSITKSVHELSRGTERLRRGDFSHPIPIGTRDQLGDLAESFNTMAQGIQDLLLQQAEKDRLEEELRIARQIQMSLLPQASVTVPGLRIAALCLPAAEVGGDYYDLLPLSDTKLGVLVADVSGKGTSAALYMAELKGLVLSLSRIYQSPARLLAEANRILHATMDARTFITMTYAVVDSEARTMRYARAGHNPILQMEASTGRTRVLTPPGLGLGLDRGERFEAVLQEAEVPLVSGDVFLFFTDGLSEAMNGEAELFGERRLRDILEQAAEGAIDEATLKDRILEEIRVFVGDQAQHDDMTLVLLKVA
jgi:sigma-B regulation protein RsbU (phosphoserine phosphatase)